MRKLDWLVVRDFALIETAEFWQDEHGRRDIAHRGLLLPRRGAHREGRHVHQHAAAAAVAPQGGRAAGRLPQRAVVHVPPRPQAASACTSAPPKRRTAPLLELTWDYPTDRRHRGARRRSRPSEGDQRLHRRRRRRRSAASPTSRTTARPRAAAGSTPAATRTASTRRRGASRRRSSTGSRPSGDGHGRRTGASCTTAPPPTRTASRGPSARRTSGGTRSRASGPATTCPTSSPTARRRIGRRRTRTATTRSRGDDAVHHAGRRQRLDLRADGLAGRAAADALRAAGIVVENIAVRPAVQPGAHGVDAATTTRTTAPSAIRSTRT